MVLPNSVPLMSGVNLTVNTGKFVSLVGATGSGKSTIVRTVLGLNKLRITTGCVRVSVGNRTYTVAGYGATAQSLNSCRGTIFGFIPQDSNNALNPMWSVEQHLMECVALKQHPRDVDPAVKGASQPQHFGECVETILNKVGLTDTKRILELYPHQLSGGMAKRVLIAMVLARGSSIILADEPVANLDSVSKMQILQLFLDLTEKGYGVLWVTHDRSTAHTISSEVFTLADGKCDSKPPCI